MFEVVLLVVDHGGEDFALFNQQGAKESVRQKPEVGEELTNLTHASFVRISDPMA